MLSLLDSAGLHSMTPSHNCTFSEKLLQKWETLFLFADCMRENPSLNRHRLVSEVFPWSQPITQHLTVLQTQGHKHEQVTWQVERAMLRIFCEAQLSLYGMLAMFYIQLWRFNFAFLPLCVL